MSLKAEPENEEYTTCLTFVVGLLSVKRVMLTMTKGASS